MGRPVSLAGLNGNIRNHQDMDLRNHVYGQRAMDEAPVTYVLGSSEEMAGTGLA